jgi:uncharacterized protein
MKKIIIIILILVSVLQLQAQKVSLSNTILWKISGNGLAKDSYIFLTGSSCDESLKLSDKTKEAFKNTDVVTVEYDLYGSKDVNKLAADNIATLDSQKMKNILTPAQVTEFENTLKNSGYPEQAIPQMQTYKMGMAYYILVGINGPCGMDKQPLAYELEFKPLAKKNNKTYTILQNIDEFLKESNSYSNMYWKQNVGYILKNADNVKIQLSNEAELYKNKQLKDLQMLYKNDPVFKLLYQDNVYKNHVNFMAEKIQKQIQQSSSFISIQISNVMYNDCSVFEILAQKGYTITPVIN